MCKPNINKIEEVLRHCAKLEEEGDTLYSGMTYEQGVAAALNWMQGDGSCPIEEDELQTFKS